MLTNFNVKSLRLKFTFEDENEKAEMARKGEISMTSSVCAAMYKGRGAQTRCNSRRTNEYSQENFVGT